MASPQMTELCSITRLARTGEGSDETIATDLPCTNVWPSRNYKWTEATEHTGHEVFVMPVSQVQKGQKLVTGGRNFTIEGIRDYRIQSGLRGYLHLLLQERH